MYLFERQSLKRGMEGEGEVESKREFAFARSLPRGLQRLRACQAEARSFQ